MRQVIKRALGHNPWVHLTVACTVGATMGGLLHHFEVNQYLSMGIMFLTILALNAFLAPKSPPKGD